MNILAHAWLSGGYPDLMVGNFVGDFIKGDPAAGRHHLTPGQIAGVRLHRAIDTFTDAHPHVAAVRRLLHPRCHKYAGAAVDIFFDHFLATDFQELTGQGLPKFVQIFYRAIEQNITALPPAAARMAAYMIRQDWLTNYQFIEGIDRSLKGVARRTTYPSGLDTAIDDLRAYHDPIARHFSYFWPDLVDHCQQIRTEVLSNL